MLKIIAKNLLISLIIAFILSFVCIIILDKEFNLINYLTHFQDSFFGGLIGCFAADTYHYYKQVKSFYEQRKIQKGDR